MPLDRELTYYCLAVTRMKIMELILAAMALMWPDKGTAPLTGLWRFLYDTIISEHLESVLQPRGLQVKKATECTTCFSMMQEIQYFIRCHFILTKYMIQR